MNLDTLSSDDAGEPVISCDISITVQCGSDDGHTTMGSDQALSDVDLPAGSPSEDRRQVLRTQDLSPEDWSFRQSVSMCQPADGSDGQTPPSAGIQASVPAVRPQSDEPEPERQFLPLVRQVDVLVVKPVEPVQLSSHPLSGHQSPRSPATIAFEDLEDSSTPLSPNHVQMGRSQEMPADESIFCVLPDTPAFVRRTLGAAQQMPGAALPLPLAFDSLIDPFFGAPIAFAQCDMIPESDDPVTLSVYAMPPGAPCVAGPSSVSTVLASGVQWSTNRDRLEDVTREGPFDAVDSPMDTDNSPLVTAGLPGCPYRITSYTGRHSRTCGARPALVASIVRASVSPIPSDDRF